jgi:Sensors of blue-light using FAD
MESLTHLIYASTAVRRMSQPELLAILERARETNTRLGLTGMLLHAEGHFFQVLEGDADAVEPLFAKISSDPRHEKVVLIVREPISERAFKEWSMGFASVTHAEVSRILGANDYFTHRSCFEGLTPGRATKLLDAFAQGRWRSSTPIPA